MIACVTTHKVVIAVLGTWHVASSFYLWLLLELLVLLELAAIPCEGPVCRCPTIGKL